MSKKRYIPVSKRREIAAYLQQNSDATLTSVAERFGCSHMTVWRILQAYYRRDSKLGVNGKAESWLELRERIMTARRANPEMNYAELGRLVHCSDTMVRKVLGVKR